MKLIKGLICICFAVCGLSGCHGSRSQNSFSVPEEFDTSRSYEITFWAKNDTNKTQVEIYESAIADFESLYPNIHVNMRTYTDYGKIYNDVITNIATNTTPNVCITYPDHIATYLTGANTVTVLDDLFEDEKYGFGGSALLYDAPTREEMIPEFLDEGILSGNYYAIPYMRSTEALYINKDFVEKLGYEIPDIVTWDWVFEVSRKAAEKDSEGNYILNGQKVLLPFIYKSTDNMMITYLKQMNAGYSTEAGDIEIFNDVTNDFLYTIAENTAAGAFSTFKISGYPANFLNAGQCVFAIDSTAGSTWMGSEAPLSDIAPEKLVKFETVVRPVPQVDVEDPKMISQGPSLCIFNKEDPQEVLASWIFAQYLLTNDVQIAYAQTEGYIPVTYKAQTNEEYQEYLNSTANDELHYKVKLEACQLLIENINHTFVTPVFNGSASLRDAAGELIETVTKSVRRKKTIDEAFMEQLEEDVIALYRLDQIGTDGTSVVTAEGPLPTASRILLTTLVVVWIAIGAYVLYDRRRTTSE